MKLQQLQLDLEVIPFADVPGFVLRLTDVNRLLEALQVLERKTEGRFSQQDGDKLLADIEGQSALGVGNLGASDGGLVLGRLQAMLAFAPTLKEISQPGIELLNFSHIVGVEVGRSKNRQELGIEIEGGVGTQIRGNLLRLVLKNQRASGLEGVIMSQCQINRLIKSDHGRVLRFQGRHKQQQCRRYPDAYPDVLWAHRIQFKVRPSKEICGHPIVYVLKFQYRCYPREFKIPATLL